jgi:heat shock protein HslJ
MMTVVVATLAGMLLLVLGACAVAVPGTGGDTLDGTSWELMTYGETKPIPGTTITATFEDGRVTGSAGCNTYFGSYQVDGDRIRVGDMAMTEMACLEPEGAMEQELVFAELMRGAQSFRLADGQLEIFGADGEALTLVPRE